MAAGLQVFDGAGNVIVEITSRLTKLLGTQLIPGTPSASGTISITSNDNDIWYYFQPSSTSVDAYSFMPSISISGNVIIWQHSAAPALAIPPGVIFRGGILYYGVY